MSTIISSVIISAQTTDLILIAIFNWTGNCHLHPAALPVHSSRTPPNSKCAFNEGDTSLCNMPRVAGLSACFRLAFTHDLPYSFLILPQGLWKYIHTLDWWMWEKPLSMRAPLEAPWSSRLDLLLFFWWLCLLATGISMTTSSFKLVLSATPFLCRRASDFIL